MSLTPLWTSASPLIEPSPEPRGQDARRPGFSPDHPPPHPRARAVAFLASLVLTAPVLGATAASAGMTVTLVGASAGQTVTGGLALEARASGGTPTRVEFTVDGAFVQREGMAPYCLGGDSGRLPCNLWDSRRVADGQRTIRATAYDAAGGSAAASVTVTVRNATSSPAPTASPSLSHMHAFDFVRGIRHIYDAAKREQAWQWAAAHLDGLEADGSFASEMLKRDGTIKPFSYRLDLTACQHTGCSYTYPVDTSVSSLPENYYLHFSETTTLTFVKLNGTVVKTVTIPGCPAGTAVTKACRVQIWMWGDTRWVFNVNDPGFQTWQANRLVASLSSGQKGMFLDEHGPTLSSTLHWGQENKPVSGGGIRELNGYRPGSAANALYNPMVTGWLTVLRAKAKAAGKFVMPNLGTYALKPEAIDQAMAAGGVSTEQFHRPDAFDGAYMYGPFIKLMKDLAAVGAVVDLHGSSCHYGPSGYTAGNYGSSKARYWMWRLASYYIVREPVGSPGRIYFNPAFCMTNWATDPLGWTKEWLPAYDKGFGAPAGEATVFKKSEYSYTTSSGQKTCGYSIYQRPYAGGLVLLRPKDPSSCPSAPYGDASAVTLYLPKAMRMLREDGTLAAASSTVRLRNAEAVILLN
jgi:hypothetical protein